MGLKLLCWWDDVDCYDVLHRNLMVSRDYELIIYKIIEVTKSFLSVDIRYMMVWIDSWNGMWKLAWSWHCDSIILPQWRSTFRLEVSNIILEWESYLSCDA